MRKLPVLIIGYIRLDEILAVFRAVRDYQPSRLYISLDGGRTERESEIVLAIQNELRSLIDWECKVSWRVSDFNQGCRLACTNAVSWLFEMEESGIILEDDCVPNGSFFEFCEWGIESFKEDRTINLISGSRFSSASSVPYLSKFAMIWGWATWRDRWQAYSPDIDPRLIDSFSKNISSNFIEYLSWRELMFRLHKGGIPSAWDFQLLFKNVSLRQYSLVPPANLIKNIGVGVGSTNNSVASNVNFLDTREISKECYKDQLPCPDDAYDREVSRNFFNFTALSLLRKTLRLLLSKV